MAQLDPGQGQAQDIIAMIWDFDLTLISHYMQLPLFKYYKINDKDFWAELNTLESVYLKREGRVNTDTLYLNHILTYVAEGRFKGLNNDLLRSLGKKLKFFPGMPDFLDIAKRHIEADTEFSKFGINVEHYIISTGLAEMIRGSKADALVEGIWGCEFIQNPLVPRKGKLVEKVAGNEVIAQVGYAIDNTSKTRAIFEINKGANKFENVDVNQPMADDVRRIPFENMIYIADGPSDVPAFSLIMKNGGTAFAVYSVEKEKSFAQADDLRASGRIHMHGEANYEPGTHTYRWLILQLEQIAHRIYDRKMGAIMRGGEQTPEHIV